MTRLTEETLAGGGLDVGCEVASSLPDPLLLGRLVEVPEDCKYNSKVIKSCVECSIVPCSRDKLGIELEIAKNSITAPSAILTVWLNLRYIHEDRQEAVMLIGARVC